MLLIITKPLSGVGHDKFSSRFGVEIAYSLSLDIHPVTSRAFFMETVYNFNDFYPFPKIWILVRFLFLHLTNLFPSQNFSFPNMLPWWPGLTISLSRARLFWPDLSFGLMTTGQQKALHRNLGDTRKTWSGQKTNISSQSVVRKIQIKRQKRKGAEGEVPEKWRDWCFIFISSVKLSLDISQTLEGKKIIRGGVRLPRVMTKKRDQGQNKGPVTK